MIAEKWFHCKLIWIPLLETVLCWRIAPWNVWLHIRTGAVHLGLYTCNGVFRHTRRWVRVRIFIGYLQFLIPKWLLYPFSEQDPVPVQGLKSVSLYVNEPERHWVVEWLKPNQKPSKYLSLFTVTGTFDVKPCSHVTSTFGFYGNKWLWSHVRVDWEIYMVIKCRC